MVVASTALLAGRDIELGWLGKDPDVDQTFIRHMSTHHQQGIELAALGSRRAFDPHLRSLAALMAASQSGERRILGDWWRRWFGVPMEGCSNTEAASMLGYLTAAQLDRVRTALPDRFDAIFVAAMTFHHSGGVQMADDEMHNGSDPRLRIMAHSIRHGQIALLNGAGGLDAVAQATKNMFGNRLTEATAVP